jgi:hypothetical protein
MSRVSGVRFEIFAKQLFGLVFNETAAAKTECNT